MYCSNCGTELSDTANFCASCGAKVIKNTIPNAESRTMPSSSVIKNSMKCKMCNGIMNLESGNMLVCPYCGYKELLTENANVSMTRVKSDAYKEVEIEKLNTVKELERLKAELEMEMKNNNSSSDLLHKLEVIDLQQPAHVRFFHKEEDIAAFECEKKERKANLIKSYPLPESFKGLYDLFRMAEINIDYKLSKRRNLAGKIFADVNDYDKKISDAWLDKFRRVYLTLERLHYDDPRFSDIKIAYENKMRELKYI